MFELKKISFAECLCDAPIVSFSCVVTPSTSWTLSLSARNPKVCCTVKNIFSTPPEEFFVPCRVFREVFSVTVKVTGESRFTYEMHRSAGIVISVGISLQKAVETVKRAPVKVWHCLTFDRRLAKVLRL